MDLVKRILYHKDKGNDEPYNRVLENLRNDKHSFGGSFHFQQLEIRWQYFSTDNCYDDLILEENKIYLYCCDPNHQLELIVRGHTFDTNKLFEEKIFSFSGVYVLSSYFPGLDEYHERPVELHTEITQDSIAHMSFHLRKMLESYERRNKPIFKWNWDFRSKQSWIKIVDKKKNGR